MSRARRIVIHGSVKGHNHDSKITLAAVFHQDFARETGLAGIGSVDDDENAAGLDRFLQSLETLVGRASTEQRLPKGTVHASARSEGQRRQRASTEQRERSDDESSQRSQYAAHESALGCSRSKIGLFYGDRAFVPHFIASDEVARAFRNTSTFQLQEGGLSRPGRRHQRVFDVAHRKRPMHSTCQDIALRVATLCSTVRCAGLMVIVATVCWLFACGASEPRHESIASPMAQPSIPATDLGERAWARAARLLTLPRALGDPRRSVSIDALRRELERIGAQTIERVDHDANDPRTGHVVALTELIGHVRPEASKQFVLASHFDVRHVAEREPDPRRRQRPIPGANDGTSGVALVLELALALTSALPNEVGFAVILFDGEELGYPDFGGYCMGSRHIAERIQAGKHPILARARFGVVLDMVGDRDLSILVEPGSREQHRALVEHIWDTARRIGATHFHAEEGPRLLDDHVFLGEAGIPSVLVIDYAYPHWHTQADTWDKLSATSFREVGDTLVAALTSWWAHHP